MVFTAVVLCRLCAQYVCHPYDDAFITFRYAQNLAGGHGFVYNPGAPWEPVLGTTTPLYTLVVAAGCWIGVDALSFARLLNVACDGVAAVLLCGLLRREVGGLAALVAFAAFALSPQLNRISAGAMEPPLLNVLALASCVLAVRGRLATASLLAGLAALTRPEAALLAALLPITQFPRGRRMLRAFVPAALLGLVYIAVATWYFGSPVPQSVAAKVSQYAGNGRGSEFLALAVQSFAPNAAALGLIPLAVLGLVGALSSTGATRLFSVWALMVFSAYALGRPSMTPGWYHEPMLVAWCLWIGSGVAAVGGALAWTRRWTFGGGGAAVPITTGLVAATALAAALRLGPSPEQRMYADVAQWAKSTATGDATILAFDIGWIGYVSPARVLDAGGLVWPGAGQASATELMKRHRPDYAFLTATRTAISSLQNDPALAAEYQPIARFCTTAGARPDPDPATLSNRWRPDYILYARQGGGAARVPRPSIPSPGPAPG